MSNAVIRPRWGIFGGTFDPPHLGHLAAARAVRAALGLERVVLMVAGEPWQKLASSRDLTPAALRLEMVRALVANEEGIEAGDDEVRRPGPTYTVDTLRGLHENHPDVDWFLVLGADAAANLVTWRDPTDVLALSTIVVVSRPGSEHSAIFTGQEMFKDARIEWVEMEPVDVSSTDIRHNVAGGGEATGTSAAVARIIKEHRLYQDAR